MEVLTGRLIARAQAERDGRFALATVETGACQLEFSGVDHYSATVPLVALEYGSFVVNTRLRHYAYADSLNKVTALGDWNHNSFRLHHAAGAPERRPLHGDRDRGQRGRQRGL